MNLTKTIHKTPIDASLTRQGWTEHEKQHPRPKYDTEYTWVSGIKGVSMALATVHAGYMRLYTYMNCTMHLLYTKAWYRGVDTML